MPGNGVSLFIVEDLRSLSLKSSQNKQTACYNSDQIRSACLSAELIFCLVGSESGVSGRRTSSLHNPS